MKKTFLVTVLVVLFAGLSTAAQNPSSSEGHWVSTWSTATHAPLAFPGLPPTPVFDDQTIRMIVRSTIAGDRARIRLSNAFGTTPLSIGAVHIAIASQGSKIVPESDRAVTFGGKGSVVIPPGAPILSDPVDLKLPAFAEVAITVYLPEKTTATTVHFWAQQNTYVSEAGNFTAKAEIPSATTKTSWYWISDLEVWAPDRNGAIVALGDSITDGVGAKQGEYGDWPDLLAKRLAADGNAPPLAVINEGIGGNRLLHDGAGVSTLARFDRDVLAQPGVTSIILLEGINDIGWPHMKPRPLPDGTLPKMPFAQELVSAEEVIGSLRQVIERAHQHGIRVFGATLTPYEGADYYTADGEETRQAVNRWIRTGGAFDGVFDFDAAVRDPKHPSQFREDYHMGDHLHPSAAGYRAMADAIDLSVLKGVGEAHEKK